MVRELEGARVTPAPWRRMWTRIYEHTAAFFLTPQQWGLDSEIVLALPLQGLVVTGVGDDTPSTASHLLHGGDDFPGTGSGGAACANDQDLTNEAANSEYKATCFMLLVSSSSQREHFPRLLVSGAAGFESSRSFVHGSSALR